MQTQAFFDCFEAAPVGDALINAGLAHLWLVTLHPFDDGNGRQSRAVGDMALARAEGTGQRFYSFSAQIQRERQAYYDQQEATQKDPLDVTPWLEWFLSCLLCAVQGADATLAGVLDKAQFWQRWAGTPMNVRQTLVLNRVLDRVLDGMEGRLTNANWAAIGKCSADTALRDFNDLVERGVLRRLEGGGAVRGTSYVRNKSLALFLQRQFAMKTLFSSLLLSPNDKVVVDAFDDPAVDGVGCRHGATRHSECRVSFGQIGLWRSTSMRKPQR